MVKRQPRRARTAAASKGDLLSRLTAKTKGKRLSEEQAGDLIGMLARQHDGAALDLARLAPPGSFLRRMQRHFDDTDISYALPVFHTVMLAASWLTQRGASLEIDGLGRIRPTLWIVGLAESGSAKTLASDRINSYLLDGNAETRLDTLQPPGSDAQWIEDLATHNGAFWFQDEAGKLFNAVFKDSRFTRIKPWVLAAYSHGPIGNRLKTETSKLVIGDPHFTFYGLSVFSTWRDEIDARSMLDGFMQRFNYAVAPRRTDTDMFDHFLYFAGASVAEREADLNELWAALCAQPGAAGVYRVGPGVLDFLSDWWRGLREKWGDGGVPPSFVRRIGFSVLRYLVVLQFLLGKSRAAVDIETARLATRYAEFHLESAWVMLEAYDQDAASRVQTVVRIRQDLRDSGKAPSVRNISRRLSKKLRGELTSETIAAICCVLDDPTGATGDADPFAEPGTVARKIAADLDKRAARYAHNERKRNERRLRELRRAYRARGAETSPEAEADEAGADGQAACENVVPLHRVTDDSDDADPRAHRM